MIEQNRGLSWVAYTFDGGKLQFPVTFPYLDRKHVRVFVGDPESARYVAHSWVSSTTIEILPQDEFLAAPYSVLIRRTTPFDVPLVPFKNGANLPASDLNKATLQLLYLHQEAVEFGGGAGSGLPGGGGSAQFPDLNTIIDQVVNSPAFSAATGRIDEVDANAELVMAEILRSNDYFDLNRILEDRMGKAEIGIEASYDELVTIIKDDISATVTKIEEMYARITDETGTNLAHALNGMEVSVTDVESRVSTVESRVSTHEDAIAAANESLDVVTSDAQASTEWRQLFAAQYGSGTTGDSVAAAVRNVIDTKATPAEASSIASTAVSTFANGTFAALKQTFDSYVSSNDGRWSATWSIQINGGSVNNPIIAGIALSSTPAGSDFVVQADRFAFTTPGIGYAARKFPFVIGTVGGATTVGIQGQLMVDGSITADKIRVNSLAAITANMGTVNGGTFKTHTLDANGNIVDANEFRVEMSNIGDWPLWVGSGAKTANNGVFWLDREGNAMFKGKVSAPNIIGNLQRAITVSWTGGIVGNTGGATSTFTLPAPVLLGEYHVPMVQLSMGLMNTHSDEYGSINATLQRLVGGTWVNVKGPMVLGLNHGETRYDALFTADANTSSDSSYRVLITSVSSRSENIRFTSLDGYVFGLR